MFDLLYSLNPWFICFILIISLNFFFVVSILAITVYLFDYDTGGEIEKYLAIASKLVWNFHFSWFLNFISISIIKLIGYACPLWNQEYFSWFFKTLLSMCIHIGGDVLIWKVLKNRFWTSSSLYLCHHQKGGDCCPYVLMMYIYTNIVILKMIFLTPW